MFEFLAGTDPTNAASGLRIAEVRWERDDVLLGLATVPGKGYWLERNLSFPTGTWEPVDQAINGTGQVEWLRDTGAGAASCTTIYRVRLGP